MCNQLARRALGTECSFSTPSVCWTPPHYKSSKIQSEWAVWFCFHSCRGGPGVATRTSNSCHSILFLSVSPSQVLRVTGWALQIGWVGLRTPELEGKFEMSCSVPCFLKKKFVVNSCCYIWEAFIVWIQRRCPSMQGGVTKPRYIWNWIWQWAWRAAKRPSTGILAKKGRVVITRSHCWIGTGDRVAKGMEKAKIINVSFALVCADDIWVLESKASKTNRKVLSNGNLPSEKENQDKEYLKKLNKSMGHGGDASLTNVSPFSTRQKVVSVRGGFCRLRESKVHSYLQE